MQTLLKDLGRGFAEPALCSQDVFRHVLTALSLPGQVQTLDVNGALSGMEAPRGAHPAAAAVLLALLDQDCKLWLSPGFDNSDAAAWLRFHTGCVVVTDAAGADFCWIASGAEVPALGQLAQGSAEYPDTSATCIVQVDLLQSPGDATSWTLGGPGVNGCALLCVGGLALDFAMQRRESQTHFPCGVDLLFTHGQTLVGLPRSTLIES
jgi:alpha-D-ribose 1-methylphosphonate 5-triphosphate synthase subunit PhnH